MLVNSELQDEQRLENSPPKLGGETHKHARKQKVQNAESVIAAGSVGLDSPL
jgi:hypothetical protein